MKCVILLVVFLFAPLQADIPIEQVSMGQEYGGKGFFSQEEQDHGVTNEVAPLDKLYWFDGTHIYGELLEMKKGVLRWQHREGKGSWELDMGEVKTLEFSKSKDIETELRSLSKITLANGDVWHGKVLDVTDEQLTLQHPQAGELSIQIQAIQRIEGPRKSDWIYEGPSSIDEWQTRKQEGGWSYSKNALYSTLRGALISRKFPELPDRTHLQFRARWLGCPQLSVFFWSLSPSKRRQNSFHMQISEDGAHFYRLINGRGYVNGRPLATSMIDDSGRVRAIRATPETDIYIDLYLDRASRKIILMVDGEFVKEWQDHSAEKITGEHIIFQTDCSMIRLSDIRIGAWDGQLAKGKPDAAKNEDLFVLNDGNTFQGDLRSVSNGVMEIEMPSAKTFTVPLERLSYMILADVSKEFFSFDDKAVRVKWADGSRTHLNAVSFEAGALQGEHPAIGKLTCSLTVVSQLDFHLKRWSPRIMDSW